MVAGEESLRGELERRRLPSWRVPFHWWGPSWDRSLPRTLHDLVADGVIGRPTAEALTRTAQAGGSMVVAAGPSRVGKSTLAAALAATLPVDVERVYIRGSYESFEFAGEAHGGRRVMLVNEISPHLPIYLWGGATRRVLQLAQDGTQVIGTIHASTPEEVVYQLSRHPVGATPDEIAALGNLVFLGSAADGGEHWTVARVVRLEATNHGVRVEEIGD